MKKCISLISLGLILLLAQNSYAEKGSIMNMDEYTDTETNFFDGEGNKVFLDQHEGNVVLLVFWATWCGSCVSEMSALDNLAKDFRKLPFKVIALSQDNTGVEAVVKHFAEREIRHLEVFHDYQNKLFRSMSVNSLPTAFLINKEGKIKKLFRGRIKWYDDEIRSILLKEVPDNPETPKNTYKDIGLNKQVGKITSVIGTSKEQSNKVEGTNNDQQQTSK